MLLIVDYYSSLLEGSEDYLVEGLAAAADDDAVDCYCCCCYVVGVDEAAALV